MNHREAKDTLLLLFSTEWTILIWPPENQWFVLVFMCWAECHNLLNPVSISGNPNENVRIILFTIFNFFFGCTKASDSDVDVIHKGRTAAISLNKMSNFCLNFKICILWLQLFKINITKQGDLLESKTLQNWIVLLYLFCPALLTQFCSVSTIRSTCCRCSDWFCASAFVRDD